MSNKIKDLQLAGRILDSIPRLMKMIRFSFHELKPSPEITLHQLRILRRIHRKSYTVAELAETMYVSLPAITRMINVMEKQGLVKREKNLTDKRSVIVVETKRGKKVYLDTREQIKAHLAFNYIKSLSELKKQRLYDFLKESEHISFKES